MTGVDFRKSEERVAAWRKLLSENPIVAQVLVVLQDEKPSATVPLGSDAFERSAALGRLEQHDADYNLLLSLAEPLPPEPEQDESATFGVDVSKFQNT